MLFPAKVTIREIIKRLIINLHQFVFIKVHIKFFFNVAFMSISVNMPKPSALRASVTSAKCLLLMANFFCFGQDVIIIR